MSVPVLSSATTSTRWAVSSVSALRISAPNSAPLPVAAIIAVGVAKPIAHGQAMISTATAASAALAYDGAGPNASQKANTAIDTAITAGTNRADTASASR